MIEGSEFVLRTDGRGPGRLLHTVLTGDRIALGDPRQYAGGLGADERILRVLRIGVAERGLKAGTSTQVEVGLDIKSLGDGLAEILRPLNLADRRPAVLLDVIPCTVGDAGIELHRVVDAVLGADLIALHRIGLVGGRGAADAEIDEVL